ncbi:hypothetical protein F3N42_04785 [Marinihelvus fidelis]|uniref:Uncharacterized protein n=1 Tax=Marinihelvus fidelis TaxID=2613842 RepID=A0A5N0TCR0_9GAMM|nr:hypothetical protein [Marinihelvus fidelis]KAA9132541.1 hypothetical protein F3N42_04785 [Marinihelvus fidelis]
MRRPGHALPRQSGVALVLCVLLLASLSLVAMAGAGDSQVQVRVAANLSAERAALRAAKSALSWAEQWLHGLDGTSRPPACGSNCAGGPPVHPANDLPPLLEYQPESWWLSHARADGSDPITGGTLADRAPDRGPVGRWLVEELHHAAAGTTAGQPEITYYRVTARATPYPSGTPVVIESIIARPWGDASWRDAFPDTWPAPGYCLGLAQPTHCGRMAWRRRL